ncbi:hypothetical protein GGI07_002822 [Coemansia sp. Benny D115]|nr:hypothetical protein GGI07_002822 [Coemansia sp. Benny D115]
MCLSQDMSMITPAEAAGEPMDTSGYYVVGNGGAVQMGFANLSGQHINDSAYIVDSAYHVPSTILSHGMSVSRESPAACSVHSSMVYDEIDINPKIETSEANRDVCYSDCLDDEDDSEIFLLEELLARKPE